MHEQKIGNQQKDTLPYADRITAQYNQVLELTDSQTAQLVSDYLRGISVIEPNNVLLSLMEQAPVEEYKHIISFIKKISPELITEYAASSITDAFEKILEGGKTKVLIWEKPTGKTILLPDGKEEFLVTEGHYREAILHPEEHEFLPYGGKIFIGGPTPKVDGVVGNSLIINTTSTTLEINGHAFALE